MPVELNALNAALTRESSPVLSWLSSYTQRVYDRLSRVGPEVSGAYPKDDPSKLFADDVLGLLLDNCRRVVRNELILGRIV